jgi:hypothetical protein
MITINFKATNLTQIDIQFKNPDLIRNDAKPDKGWDIEYWHCSGREWQPIH